MLRWYGSVKVLGLTTLDLCGGWKARAAWEEMIDESKPASVLARVMGYFSESGAGVDAKNQQITELEGKLRATSEKNEELQMCLDAQSNRHEFPPSPPPQRIDSAHDVRDSV